MTAASENGSIAPAPRSAWSIVLALLLGAGGGALCHAAGTPLPWMIGSMVATLAAAVAHLPIRVPLAFRQVVLPVIGVMLGSAFSPEILSSIGAWSTSLLALAAYLAVAALAGYVYFRRVVKLEPVTAYFCAVPGGLSEMTLIGAAYGGDERTISLTHASRIVVTVIAIPLLFRLMGAFDGASAATAGSDILDLSALDIALLAGCAIAGSTLGIRAGLPAAGVVGPMLFSAAVHSAGWTSGRPPAELVAVAQIILGASIGCRFAGTSPRAILRLVLASAGATLITLVIAALFGWGLHMATGLPLTALLIAYAPGGLAEMSLVALALGVDAAFVTTHHVIRILMLIIVAPVGYRWLRPGRGAKS